MVWNDDFIKWKHLPRYWPFVWGIHWSLVNSSHKGQSHTALTFCLICAWVNSRNTDYLRCHHGHYNITVMKWANKDILTQLDSHMTIKTYWSFLDIEMAQVNGIYDLVHIHDTIIIIFGNIIFNWGGTNIASTYLNKMDSSAHNLLSLLARKLWQSNQAQILSIMKYTNHNFPNIIWMTTQICSTITWYGTILDKTWY